MERINSIKDKGKRPLESGDDNEDQWERPRINNRPALDGFVIEARKVDCTNCLSLEQTIQRVELKMEKFQRAWAEMRRTLLIGRSSPQRIKGADGRNLQLQFKSSISLPLFTERKVEWEQGTAIHVELIDANAAHVVTSGLESSVKLAMVILDGDFNNADDVVWSPEEFDRHIVKERDRKRPLLIGDLQVTLKEGVGNLGDLTFTDNSSWIRSRKFRLGLKVSSGYCEGVRIREAKTEAFTVKDHRGELYKKHYPPALNDDVWRLEKIGKDGSFHKRLNNAGIYTVEGILCLVVRESQKLRNILGSGMSNKMWEALIEHAKTCSGYNDNTTRPLKSHTSSQFKPTSSTQQTNQFPYDFATGPSHSSPFDSSIQQGVSAFVYRHHHDLRSLSGLPLVPVNHPHVDNQLLFGPSSVDENMLGGGCNDNMTQLLDSNTFSQFGSTSSTQQVNPNQITGSGCNDNMTQLLDANICSQFEPAPSTQQVNVTTQITGTSNGNGVVPAVSQFPSSPWDNDADVNSLISSLFEDCAPPQFDYSIQQDVDASEHQYWEDHQYDGIVEVC